MTTKARQNLSRHRYCPECGVITADLTRDPADPGMRRMTFRETCALPLTHRPGGYWCTDHAPSDSPQVEGR